MKKIKTFICLSIIGTLLFSGCKTSETSTNGSTTRMKETTTTTETILSYTEMTDYTFLGEVTERETGEIIKGKIVNNQIQEDLWAYITDTERNIPADKTEYHSISNKNSATLKLLNKETKDVFIIKECIGYESEFVEGGPSLIAINNKYYHASIPLTTEHSFYELIRQGIIENTTETTTQ